MIAMVEGAKRQKTPNEIALDILLAALTIVFLLRHGDAAAVLEYACAPAGVAGHITVLIALLVCLIPTTIGGLLSAIGIAGMDRMMQANVIATSGRAVEAAGDVDVLLLDKTGTITLGNRQAERLPAGARRDRERTRRRRAAGLAGRRDARGPQHRRARQAEVQPARARRARAGCQLRALLGADAHERRRSAGARRPADPQGRADAIRSMSRWAAASFLPPVHARSTRWRGAAARRWWSPTARACSASSKLKDIVKGGIKERFAELRRMGIKTVMITGDNR
jgi:K+-transporting ATPase ATPase B chain